MAIIAFVRWIVTESRNELLGTPAFDRFRGRQLASINVDDRSIRPAEFVHMFQSADVNFFGEIETFAVSFCKADEFFQPRCASRLDVQTGTETLQRFPH